MNKKKLLIILAIVIILVILLVPFPNRYKDGGTVEYKALLYSYTKYHALTGNKTENGQYEEGFEVGSELKILWFSIYKDTHFEKSEKSNTLIDNSGNATDNNPTIEPTIIPTDLPDTTPKPTPTQIYKDLPLLPSGKALSIDELPRVDGAKALEPFYDDIFARLLGISIEDAKTLVMCNNTPSAYKNLTYGNADMIFCALPSEEQIAEAEENGVEFEYHTVLSGGFVFFVNKDNPVNSVTQEELKGIVSGKITNWKELGGEDEPIILYQRNEGSGSQTGLYRYVLPKEEVMPPILERYEDSMEGVVDRVSDYENGRGAISYSYYYYVANMYTSDEIKLLGIDGISPSDETISKGEYPFLNFSQIVTRSDLPENSIVRDIIRFVQGADGADIARANGYVPYLPSEGSAGTGKERVSYDSYGTIEKNKELHGRLASANEFSLTGTGKTISSTIIKDREYGVCRNNPDILDLENLDGIASIHVKGLKDKTVEKKINDRIDDVIEIILDPAFFPDVSGIVPFLKEHGACEKDIYTNVNYCSNHILSIDLTVTYRWEKFVTEEWFKDIPDLDGDGRIDDNEIYDHILYNGTLPETILGIDVYTGRALKNKILEQRVEYYVEFSCCEYKPLNFNLETGEELQLSDMFPEGYDYFNDLNSSCYEQAVKYNYTFSDYYLSESGRETEGYFYNPGLEYDGGTVFVGVKPGSDFFIYGDNRISLYNKETEYFYYVDLTIPVFNMITFSDIFEMEENKSVSYLENYSYGNWYNPRYEIEKYDFLGSFDAGTNEENAISIPVYIPLEYDNEIMDYLPKDRYPALAYEIFQRSTIEPGKDEICYMAPNEMYIYPNGYLAIEWIIGAYNENEEYEGAVYSYITQWVKDGKDVNPLEFIDIEPEELIKKLLLKIRTWSYTLSDIEITDEEADKAAKILAPHLVSFNNSKEFAPVFDFCLDGSMSANEHTNTLSVEEKQGLPSEVFICVTDSSYWDYQNWDVMNMNDYYCHLKIYEGYDF